MSEHRHLEPHELLDALLEEGRGRRSASAGCARCESALAELEGFLGRCREAALGADAQPAEARRVSARVLARTTREDLGWRGDLRLLHAFVAQRLRSSGVLRFAAASLLVHLLALPVLAWFAFREAPRRFEIQVGIEYPREQALPDVPPEPERVLEAPGPGPEPRLVEHQVLATAERATSARRAERAFLLAAGIPMVRATDEGVARLLWARSARLHEGRLPAFLERGTPPDEAGTLEQALWAEILMDHLMLAGERLPGLDAALDRLDRGREGSRAERLLGALALRRAATCGLLDEARTSRVRATLVGLGLSPEGGVEDAESWARALAEALAGSAAADSAAARSWAAWGR